MISWGDGTTERSVVKRARSFNGSSLITFRRAHDKEPLCFYDRFEMSFEMKCDRESQPPTRPRPETCPFQKHSGC